MSIKTENSTNIVFIGFGEAAIVFARGILSAQRECQISAFDIKTNDEKLRDSMLSVYKRENVRGGESTKAATAGAEIIFSTVTADRALKAAQQAAEGSLDGAIYADCNSCAPDTKRLCAKIVEAAGGRYVDVAVMAPVGLPLRKTPLLLSGPHAAKAVSLLDGLGFSVREKSGDIGLASSIKMTRSIMIKGMEALAVECVLAGRKAGIDDEVLDSLEKSYPGFGWKTRVAYMFERMMTHGHRRAFEMQEVMKTVDDLGLPNAMSTAIAEWQQKAGDLRIDTTTIEADDYGAYADEILEKIKQS